MFWPLMQNTITWGDRFRMAKFILTTDQFTNGPQVKRFEWEWSEWLGCKHSLFVSSGSTANSLLLAAMKEMYNWEPGTKVLVPLTTWMTNVSPIIQLGMTPVFCDSSLSNYGFDSNDLINIAHLHGDTIKCVFMPHILGFYNDSTHVRSLFPDAMILEDVCESHGVEDYNGVKVGAYAHRQLKGSTFSFYFGHHMTTIEGGMVSTNDTKLFDLMKMKRSHGLRRESVFQDSKVKDFTFLTDGYNFRNTELAAVLGMSQLKRLDDMISRRRINFCKYQYLMLEYEDLFYVPTAHNSTSLYAFPFVAKSKRVHAIFKHWCELKGIETRPLVAGNLLRHPAFEEYSVDSIKNFELNSDIMHDRGLYVGNNHFVGDKHFKELRSLLEDLRNLNEEYLNICEEVL